MEEYAEVFNYVTEYICKPIRSQLKANYSNNPKDYFSRCPSGYQSRIVTARDSVTTNRYVSGKILFYRGCAPREVCVFKVCVDSGFAVVRSKGGEYMSVEKWIALRNQEGKTQVQS
jgi:hypothetical protein